MNEFWIVFAAFFFASCAKDLITYAAKMYIGLRIARRFTKMIQKEQEAIRTGAYDPFAPGQEQIQ